MSRQSIETRLANIRANEKACRDIAALYIGVAAIEFGQAAVNFENARAPQIILGSVFTGIAIRRGLESISRSNAASALEQVLAQDELVQDERAPYDWVDQDPGLAN